jgi:aryl sulfotransferase
MGERALVRYRGWVYDSARWGAVRLRPGDIVISTPPKCGTTWTQMICVLLVLQRPDIGAPLSVVSPWVDMLTTPIGDVVATLEAQRHRRVIKTHTPLDGLPRADEVTYICVGRDPRDTALSMAGHRDNMDLERFGRARAETAAVDGEAGLPPPPAPDRPLDERERFWLWVEDHTPPPDASSSLLRTLRHLETFWEVRTEPGIVLLHYDDLSADLEGEMRALADRLGIDVPEDRWPELVEAAGFAAMKRQAGALAPTSMGRNLWRDPQQFFRRGTSGQWRELLDDEGDLDRYRRRVAALVPPDLATWAHGRAGL